jgi:hypothetical protein
MLYSLTEIQSYFTPLGYTIEVGNGHLAFSKNGNYVSVQLSDLGGSLEQMQNIVEERFEAGKQYLASQIE